MYHRYLDDIRKHYKELKKAKPSKGDKSSKGDKHDRKKEIKRIELKRQQLKVLLKYIDKDYASVKNRYELSSPTPPLFSPC